MALSVDQRISDHPTLAGSSARRLGAYYTPAAAAQFMARWALRTGLNRVLEPSMGDGEFLRAVAGEAAKTGAQVDLWGVELARDTYEATVAAGVVEAERAILNDFLAVPTFPVDVVIGNPPYVRLRHLSSDDAERARSVAAKALGKPMDPSGSLWMPFVLHATDFLAPAGRMAFVLPYELTYVRYARPLWRHLAARFATLRVVRVHERIFPEILQDIVLLLADGHGSATDQVLFEAFERAQDVYEGLAVRRATISVDRITEGERPFLEALLPADLTDLINGRITSGTQPAREVATFNIGYVSGDKRFFHPSATTAAKYQLPHSSLVPTITSSRRTAGAGLWTSQLPPRAADTLFLPGESLGPGERRYIRHGKREGVDARYKTSIRDPWYVTPGVKVPDLLLPVFAERPLLMVNDGRYAASNSLLAAYLTPTGAAGAMAAAWYTSLTLLQVELNVHSLGGGVMVFVPQEAGNVRLTRGVWERSHLRFVDAQLRAGNVEAAYREGDTAVMHDQLGLTAEQANLVRDGIDLLRHWRTARTRGAVAD